MGAKFSPTGSLYKAMIGKELFDDAEKLHNEMKNPQDNKYDKILNNQPIKKPKNIEMGVANMPANKWATMEILDEMYKEAKFNLRLPNLKMKPQTKEKVKKIFHEGFLQKGVSSVAKIGTGAAVGYGVSKLLGSNNNKNNSSNNSNNRNSNIPRVITIDIPTEMLYKNRNHHYNPHKIDNRNKTASARHNQNGPFRVGASWKNFMETELPKDIAKAIASAVFPAITVAGIQIVKDRFKKDKPDGMNTQKHNIAANKLNSPPKGFTRITLHLDNKSAVETLDEMYKEARYKDERNDVEKGNEKHIKEISSSDEKDKDKYNATRVLFSYDKIKETVKNKNPRLP